MLTLSYIVMGYVNDISQRYGLRYSKKRDLPAFRKLLQLSWFYAIGLGAIYLREYVMPKLDELTCVDVESTLKLAERGLLLACLNDPSTGDRITGVQVLSQNTVLELVKKYYGLLARSLESSILLVFKMLVVEPEYPYFVPEVDGVMVQLDMLYLLQFVPDWKFSSNTKVEEMGPAADGNNIFCSYVDDCSATPTRVTDVSTARDKSTSKKRGYDAVYLRHKQPKRVRIQMEDKSKGEIIIGGKRTKSPKPVKLKETRSSKSATAQKLPNVGRYNKVSVRKIQNDTQAQSMKQDQKAHGDILGKRNKSVHQVGPSDSTLQWHAQPQIDWSKDVSDNIKDKEGWWEEETKLFRKRANSFIACMNQVQGNRHFSAWRGSIVDSVVGAFLTQNAKDQSSSSAFMSLAAKYPTIQMEQACDYARNEKNVRSLAGWDFLECIYYTRGTTKERSNDTMDSLDWEAVREAPLTDISKSIFGRGMNNKLAECIKVKLVVIENSKKNLMLVCLEEMVSS